MGVSGWRIYGGVVWWVGGVKMGGVVRWGVWWQLSVSCCGSIFTLIEGGLQRGGDRVGVRGW